MGVQIIFIKPLIGMTKAQKDKWFIMNYGSGVIGQVIFIETEKIK